MSHAQQQGADVLPKPAALGESGPRPLMPSMSGYGEERRYDVAPRDLRRVALSG